MKGVRIIYWITTALVSLMMLISAYAYLTNPVMSKLFSHLGYPSYFRVELAICKIIGVVLLLAPINRIIKEWAYAGFSVVFVSAMIAHICSGDPLSARVMPLVFLILLMVSYFTRMKIQSYYRN